MDENNERRQDVESAKIFPKIRGNRALCERLWRDITAGGLTHAYIIEGPHGSGRKTLAKNIAAAVSCVHSPEAGGGAEQAQMQMAMPQFFSHSEAEHTFPCGECEACRKIFAGISPDVITVSREDGKAGIGVDVIRELRTDVHIIPNELEHKIYIIDDADKMTTQAQNALLLTLEEPPAYAIFLLIAESSRNMLETIRSRAPSLRTQPLSPQDITEIVRQSSPEAARLCESDRNAFLDLVMASDGSAGRAIELIGGRQREGVLSRRHTAESFCELVTQTGRAAELVSLLSPYSGGKRDEAAKLMDDISLALRDLALKKKSEDAPLRFFADRDRAEELCGQFTLSRLIALYDAVEAARVALAQNANTKLTVFELISTACDRRTQRQ